VLNHAIGGVHGYALVVMEQLKRATRINVVGVHYKALGADLPDGSRLGGSSPEEFGTFWRPDRARTGKVLADAGIAPE
jgi:hypothetical protein